MKTSGQIVFPHQRLTPDQARAAGYIPLHVRADDGTVQSMRATGSGYRITYGAPSYTSAVRAILKEQADAK